jgi:hypothetical protein
MFVEGEFLDTVIGIPDSRTEIVMLQPPDGGTRLELSSFVGPDHLPGSPAAPAIHDARFATGCRRPHRPRDGSCSGRGAGVRPGAI